MPPHILRLGAGWTTVFSLATGLLYIRETIHDAIAQKIGWTPKLASILLIAPIRNLTPTSRLSSPYFCHYTD
jgi:hypothetical protein